MKLASTILRRRRVSSQVKDLLIVFLATAVAGLVLWSPRHNDDRVVIQSRDYQSPFVNHHRNHEEDDNLQSIPRIKPDQTFFHTYPDNNRYMSGDIWRPPESFGPQIFSLHDKTLNQPGKINIQQHLTPDYAANTDKLLLLVKTGSKTIWERMPVHVFTTLTRFQNFAIYSDSADSIAGYEVIDILANISQSLLLVSDQFSIYRKYRRLRSQHNYLGVSETSDTDTDGWALDKFKNIRMLYHAYKESPDMDWYVMIDDDTIILADNLSRFLATLDARKEYYLGSAVAGLEYIFAHGGSGIVLSQGAMKKAFGDVYSEEWVDKYTLRAENECCGDYMVAMYLKETADISLDFETSGGRFQGEPLWGVPCSTNNWCQEIITLHHQRPADFELIWEYERIRKVSGKRSPTLYSDIYNDFIKPYFPKGPQINWDNGAKDVQFSWSKEVDNAQRDDKPIPSLEVDTNKPYGSVQSCRRECEAKPDCIMYRYDPYLKYCGLSSSTIALGRPVIKYDDSGYHDRCRKLKLEYNLRDVSQESQQMISGWYLDRVIAMRQGLFCDCMTILKRMVQLTGLKTKWKDGIIGRNLGTLILTPTL